MGCGIPGGSGTTTEPSLDAATRKGRHGTRVPAGIGLVFVFFGPGVGAGVGMLVSTERHARTPGS